MSLAPCATLSRERRGPGKAELMPPPGWTVTLPPVVTNRLLSGLLRGQTSTSPSRTKTRVSPPGYTSTMNSVPRTAIEPAGLLGR